MGIHDISSRSNPAFRSLLRLLDGRGVKKQRLSLLSGPKQVKEVLLEFSDRCEAVIQSKKHKLPDDILAPGLQTYLLSAELFREVDAFGTNQPVLIVRVPPFPAWNSREPVKGCTLLIPFQDPGNVGAVIRSAAAFGVVNLVVLKEAAHPFHYKSTRAAGSALFRVPMFEGPSIQELGRPAAPVITLSAGGEDIRRFRFPESFCLLPGLEGPGLPPALRHLKSVSIPMERGVESLNAALATGIALYEWQRNSKKV